MSTMTRAEMAKLCYLFMGWNHQGYETWLCPCQAMEIAHKMRISSLYAAPNRWIAHGPSGRAFTEADNPRRAIMECAAQILANQ